jgi:hypothetical protein
VTVHIFPQDQSLLASSLQTAHNLGLLPELVQSLVQDLSSAVDERIRTAFDLGQISKEVLAKGTAQIDTSRPLSGALSISATFFSIPTFSPYRGTANSVITSLQIQNTDGADECHGASMDSKSVGTIRKSGGRDERLLR